MVSIGDINRGLFFQGAHAQPATAAVAQGARR